jgi:hypothetical protein
MPAAKADVIGDIIVFWKSRRIDDIQSSRWMGNIDAFMLAPFFSSLCVYNSQTHSNPEKFEAIEYSTYKILRVEGSGSQGTGGALGTNRGAAEGDAEIHPFPAMCSKPTVESIRLS